jgi:transcriptional regulator with XRE-family HTH domain
MYMPARKEPDTRMYVGRFAVRLRTLRERAGLSIEDMVDKTGIPAQTLYSWEQGKYTPPMETYPLLAETLGVKVRTLLPEE